jgi:Xaa-Pro aminopeptidase
LAGERLNSPISTQELERRWSAIRSVMSEQGVDVLLMQNNNDFMGGYVKYFTDLPALNGYATTVVFPKDDDMTVITHAPFGTDRKLDPSSETVMRGVKRVLGHPYFANSPYTLAPEVELAKAALEGFAGGTIGIVGPSTLPYPLIDGLKRGRLSNFAFLDVSDMVDHIKAVKSPEELAQTRKTARIQDGAIEAAFAAIKPGMKEIEVAAIAQEYCVSRGSEQGIYLTCSYKPGEPVRQAGRYFQNRILREGDLFTLLVETNGPGGFFTEIGRTCILGKAPADIKEEHDFIIAARQYTLDRLRPGKSCKDVFDSYNEFLKANKKAIESRVHCHGQGYDMVERPLVRNDEPMILRENMNIACHPNYVTDRVFATFCDNYFIQKNGVERIHSFAETLIEI